MVSKRRWLLEENNVGIGLLVLFRFFLFSFCSRHLWRRKKHGDQILQKYSKQVIEIESALAQEQEKFNLTGKENIQKTKEIQTKKKRVEELIKKEGGFLYTHIHTISYPSGKGQFSTIEVVKKDQPERLAFITSENRVELYSKQADLIETMREYGDLG